MKIIFTLVLCFTTSLASNRWPTHDISTLKLLQIVHRHGDRAPTEFEPNDPFRSDKYWMEGTGGLSNKGKYRLYKLGQFIREEYNAYLDEKYSPREVFVRSSVEDRCIESTSCLLSGAYPPKQKDWIWDYGSDAPLAKMWQPFPIQTFMPHIDDIVCNQDKHCSAVDREKAKIYNRPLIKKFLEDNKELYQNVSEIVGRDIQSIDSAATLYDILNIEINENYFWNKTWSPEEEKRYVNLLSQSREMSYRYSWDSAIIKRLRGGGLVKELNNNIQKVLNHKNDKKLYVYSTHDSTVGAVMHALGIYNGHPPPYGALLMFELHEKKDSEYFVKVYYQNETQINTGIPHSLQWTDCPLNEYLNFTKPLLYEDFDRECKL